MTDTSTRTEHVERIADVRNSFADAVGRARYSGEVTVLTSRGKRAAAIVPMEFYESALTALGETAVAAPAKSKKD
ncbi:type II toxin-antitoxin system prevent-host-death family antitoxin [Actinacidiphila sp. ITFR-21]|uniref:type II toxin-antitoxin system prevent-host-death family antitoxin n=1 Tax=Actinacidiphila sp. ITFR-21 TaxID=3075199 RepID=UPI00288A3746|nr:type II toxin-antitoxin system prevent-host-death family antitoxin [Streptomyces sp. ITFR-21]WNI20332.1 type II toxin-antitoxin system prevent-host-death family antitoxin [Streptomyces sp. ITFR-21]